MRLTFAAVPVIAVGLLQGGAARADEHACTEVDASIVTSIVACPADFQSPVGLCTQGSVDSGPLQGTTVFRALTIGPGPTADTLLYTGELIITTSKGTVTLRDSGVLNSATGQFFETQVVTSGTGKYKSGMLTSQGFDIGTGFVGTLNGLICPGHSGDAGNAKG